MFIRRNIIVISLFCALLSIQVRGQTEHESTLARDLQLVAFQDSLVALGSRIYNAEEESQRIEANFSFVRMLVIALQQPYSFDFSFDRLNTISILKAPDQTFRVFSWHVPLADGSYLYYGAIQQNTKNGQLQLTPLLDKTFEWSNPETVITKADQWYGAQYDTIISYDAHYLLLGWKGHTPDITQKVIEVLTFQDNEVFLGAPIFESPETISNARIIFQFSSQLSMFLEYDEIHNRIVYDHLVPMDDRFATDAAHYGPDLTFDAWLLTSTGMEKRENVKIREN